MDRKIVYTGEVPLGDDFLNSEKNTMIAIGMALKAILGTATIIDGLACTPTGPASMQVQVGPGSIHALENLDSTTYGDINADTTHQLVKQGLSLDNTLLGCPAPSTTGNSINYLIQVAYEDVDTNSAVLPYFDADNPSVAFAGPANTGVSQNTTRKGECVISVKAGVSATTGTQTTPAPDAGFMGLWVVAVPNGATSITSGNISLYTGSASATGSSAFWSTPFIIEKLNDKVSVATGDLRWAPLSGASGRTRLTNNTTYYVSTSGNDSTGNGTSGTPWATLQHAINYVANSVDLAGFSVTISVADGTYTGGVILSAPFVGGGSVTLQGNLSTPANCIISTTSADCIKVSNQGVLSVGGFKLTTTTGGSGLNAIECGQLEVVGALNFGACAGPHVNASYNSFIRIAASYTISGSAPIHYFANHVSNIQVNIGITVTVTGGPAFSSAFAQTYNCSVIEVSSVIFSGSATGQYYDVYQNAVIDTGGGGATFLPGSVSGTTATGGQYV